MQMHRITRRRLPGLKRIRWNRLRVRQLVSFDVDEDDDEKDVELGCGSADEKTEAS